MTLKQINARELAEKAAVGRSFVYDILNGKSLNPTSRKLAAIAEVLGVSLPYLLTGSEEPANNNNVAYPEGVTSGDPVISIPALTVEATAGGNVLVSDDREDKPYLFRSSWLENQLQLDPSDLRIVFVQGDGMEPTLAEGDMILINTARNTPSSSGIFALFNGEGIAIKRLEKAPAGKRIRVMSDNPKYRSYDAEPDAIDILGRVVWFARQL